MSELVATSEALHARVRAFARRESEESFEALALAVARFQARHVPGFARLVKVRDGSLEELARVPGVPTDAFRLSRVAVHPSELDVARFATSGTTGRDRGIHPFRTTRTYEELALLFGRLALCASEGPRVVAALAPAPVTPPESSLGFMLDLFQRAWDGRDFDGRPLPAGTPGAFLLEASGVDVPGLERAATVAVRRGEPLLVLTTAFALVAVLDALGGGTFPAPENTVVMVTGGFKGRSREVPRAELTASTARAFGIPEAQVIGEYGMTELSSQLYEGTLPGGALRARPGVFVEPRWLRVEPVDPATLAAVPDGEVGIARIVDLGNVDSALVIQTEDLVRRTDGGVELFGRRPGAPARGCSLAVEALLG
ncbi:MAG TPA: acyl-protein synthetase [Polyangiaceae bacterium]